MYRCKYTNSIGCTAASTATAAYGLHYIQSRRCCLFITLSLSSVIRGWESFQSRPAIHASALRADLLSSCSSSSSSSSSAHASFEAAAAKRHLRSFREGDFYGVGAVKYGALVALRRPAASRLGLPQPDPTPCSVCCSAGAWNRNVSGASTAPRNTGMSTKHGA